MSARVAEVPSSAEREFTIDLPVTTEWANVEQLRSSVDKLVQLFSQDEGAGHSVSLVAAELAENAIKYGHWTAEPRVLRVRIWGQYPQAHVAVESPVGPDGVVPAALVSTLSFLQGFPTPLEAYQAKISARAEAPGEGSGLGLVRLSYETGCTLTAEVVGEVLRVSADMEIEEGRRVG